MKSSLNRKYNKLGKIEVVDYRIIFTKYFQFSQSKKWISFSQLIS